MSNFKVHYANWAFNTKGTGTVTPKDVTAKTQEMLKSSNVVNCYISELGDPGPGNHKSFAALITINDIKKTYLFTCSEKCNYVIDNTSGLEVKYIG